MRNEIKICYDLRSFHLFRENKSILNQCLIVERLQSLFLNSEVKVVSNIMTEDFLKEVELSLQNLNRKKVLSQIKSIPNTDDRWESQRIFIFILVPVYIV